ncbi:MAG: alpha/beta fold hydrolase [Promethearchaeota archaeon]
MTSPKSKKQEPVELYYVKKGQGLPLIFIHGWAASHRFWRHQIPFFAQKYQVIAYDLRGHADSSKPQKSYRVDDHVQDLVTLLADHQISNPVLVGHSLGGMIALQYTLEKPSKPRALVLVGTSPKPVASRKRSIQFSFLRLLIRLSRKRAARFTEKELFAPDVNPDLVRWVNTESLRTPTYVILQILQDVKRFDVTARLPEIQIPTLILAGEYDTAVESRTMEQMENLLPKTQIQVISGAGHNCMLEQYSTFNMVLDSFLREL